MLGHCVECKYKQKAMICKTWKQRSIENVKLSKCKFKKIYILAYFEFYDSNKSNVYHCVASPCLLTIACACLGDWGRPADIDDILAAAQSSVFIVILLVSLKSGATARWRKKWSLSLTDSDQNLADDPNRIFFLQIWQSHTTPATQGTFFGPIAVHHLYGSLPAQHWQLLPSKFSWRYSSCRLNQRRWRCGIQRRN